MFVNQDVYQRTVHSKGKWGIIQSANKRKLAKLCFFWMMKYYVIKNDFKIIC